MQVGQANIDFESNQISGPAGNYSVEPKVMKVLSILIENAGEVVTRESLIDQVWGVGYGGDERLSRAISLLRKSLGDTRGNHTFIETIPRTGYKFISEPGAPDLQQDVAIAENAAILHSSDHKAKTFPKGMIATISAIVVAMVALIDFGMNRAPTPKEPPLVIIMDSAHPARVYDEQVRAEGATNADILSDILADLPIRTQKELISPSWNRYEALTQFEPELIVIHYSGFKQEDSSGDRPQLRLLVEYFQNTETKFLVYSRAGNEWLNGNMNIILENLYEQNPDLKKRVDIFPLLEYGEPQWKDPASAQGIKLKIKETLSLE